MTVKLLASAPTLERIEEAVNRYFFGGKELLKVNENQDLWVIYTVAKQKVDDGFRVVKKRGALSF